jgi:hypothetical protein
MPEERTTPLIEPTRLSEQIDVATAARMVIVNEAGRPTGSS